MSITRNWPRSRRSTSCAPRSNWNRDPNPIRRRSHSPRSPRLPARTSAVGGSHLRTRTRRSSMQHWPLTVTRCSPSGSRITAQTTAHRKIVPRCPTTVEAFMRLVQAGWDDEAARRPHGQHTTVVVHVDVAQRAAALHLGPLLTDAERRYLTCDATCEVWFERHGEVIGAGRASRVINRRLRRALDTAIPAARFPAVGPPAVCTHTTSGTGKTVVRPTCPTWCWCARITIGCTTGAASPSPDPPTISSSPTAAVDDSAQGRWRVLRTFPRPPSHRARAPPASAPTGGGTTHSNHNHHQQTTRSTTGAR